MSSGGAGPASQHAEELTAPPEGMYWVQMQGLWALRPIVDLDYNREREHSTQPTERAARSALEQQGASLSDADRQWLSQSAGAACSAAALTEASAPPEGESSSRLEQLARMQGVVEFHHQHAQSQRVDGGPERRNEGDATSQVQGIQPLTQPPQPQAGTGQLHQIWPDWFLQWGRRVEGEGSSDNAPDPSAPPSAPPSPPEMPQRSMVKVPQLAAAHCQRPQLQKPALKAPGLWAREESPWHCDAGIEAAASPCGPVSGRSEPPTSLPLTIQAAEWFCRQRVVLPPQLRGAQLPSPWAQLVPVAPLLAMVLSLTGMIRRIEPSPTAGQSSHAATVLRRTPGRADALRADALRAACDGLPGDYNAAILFVVGAAMQCMQLLHWCALFAADVAVTLEAHLQSMPARDLLLPGTGRLPRLLSLHGKGAFAVHLHCTSDAHAPRTQCTGTNIDTACTHCMHAQARCALRARSLATFLTLQALICHVLYLRTARLAALTMTPPCSGGAFALAFGLRAAGTSRAPHAAQQHTEKPGVSLIS